METTGGLILEKDSARYWALFSPQSRQEFYNDMTEGLPAGINLHIRLYVTKLGKLEAAGINYVHPDFNFNRSIEGACAHHSDGKVTERLQGSGIGLKVNGHLFRLYEKKGIKIITVGSTKKASYTYARAGFVPTPEAWDRIRKRIKMRMDILEELGPSVPLACSSAIREAVLQQDPKSLWSIVDQNDEFFGMSLGKLLTFPLDALPPEFCRLADERLQGTGISWEGSLSMDDLACVERFKNYSYSKSSPQNRMRSAPVSSKAGRLSNP